MFSCRNSLKSAFSFLSEREMSRNHLESWISAREASMLTRTRCKSSSIRSEKLPNRAGWQTAAMKNGSTQSYAGPILAHSSFILASCFLRAAISKEEAPVFSSLRILPCKDLTATFSTFAKPCLVPRSLLHLPLAIGSAHRATAAGEMLTGECPTSRTLTIVAMLARPAAPGTRSRQQMPA